MNLTSPNFFFLLVIVLAVYYLLPRKPQNYWLLVVSYAFVITWAWQFGLILFVLTVANFFIAKKIEKTEQPGSTRLMWLGIGLNTAALVFFRFSKFYLPGLISLFSYLGIQLDENSLQIILPIGLAFYSLQNVSYLVDATRKQLSAATDFVDFALYLAYFPKLLAGPIERARTFLPKLAAPRRVDNELLARSFTLIIIGLLRKMFIASILSATILSDAFVTPANYTAPELLSWLIIYSFYLYNDFAGYTSIARGVSGLFGIELSQNFKQPYFARNMGEFWSNWHITLSHWLRDYIYFPVARVLLKINPSRRNLVNLIFPPMVTMLVSGLWHGFGWNMLLWGGLHGSYQAVEQIASLRGPVEPPQKWPIWRQFLGIAFVFILVLVAWVPFVMDLPVALVYLRGLFDWSNPMIRYRRILVVVPLIALSLLIDWLQRNYQNEVFMLRWPRLVKSFLLAISVILLAILIQSENIEPFVYQGF